MSKSTVHQPSFLGGEWSPVFSGRSDDPTYLTALSLSKNTIVSEEGAAVRRPGTQRLGPTNNRAPAKFLKFMSSTGCSFLVEATPALIRFWDTTTPVFTNDQRTVDTSSYSGGFITLGLDANSGWSVGDTVLLMFPVGYPVSSEATCRGRFFKLLTGTTGSTLVMGTDIGSQLPIAAGNFTNNTSLVGATVYHIRAFSTPYTSTDLPNLRMIQAQSTGIITVATHPTEALVVTEPVSTSTDPTFTFGNVTFVDGPYLNPQTMSLSMSALTGSITLTAGSAAFAATDVGRAVRVFTEPPLWNSGSTYSAGNTVTDSTGAWWIALASVPAGTTPGTAATISGVATVVWGPAPTAGSWAWGLITAYTNSTTVSFTFDTTISGMVLQSANGTTATTWQLGVYSATLGYASSGCYYEGRLILGGAQANRLDMSTSNGVNGSVIQFSPTDPNGNVLDSSGISVVFNAAQQNNINWIKPNEQGLVCGTTGGEWLVSASTLGDPITPTSIQAHQVTRYRSQAVEPAVLPMALAFPQLYGRRVLEYLSDAFTQRFTGQPLNEKARHLTSSGVIEIDYQDEPVPIVWCRTNAGGLIGCTYRRVSRFIQEKPAFYGWHEHQHGSGGPISALCVIPAPNGSLTDLVYLGVNDGTGTWVELLTNIQEVEPLTAVNQAWFADSAMGNAVVRPLSLCGNLFPSMGSSGSGTSSSATWNPSGSIPPLPSLLTAGTTIPPAPYPAAFVALNEGSFMNGFSTLFNFGPAKNMGGSFTLSVWLYVVDPGGSGALFSIPGILDQYPLIGNAGDPQIAWDALSGMPPAWGTTPAWQYPGAAVGFAGQWVNLLMSANGSGNFGNGDPAVIYVNDTAIPGSPDQAFLLPLGVTVSSQGLMIGGVGQAQANPGSLTPILTGNSPLPSDGGGLVAGIAELWISYNNKIDFTVQANRRLFNTTDSLNSRYAPVGLGTGGQLPLGAVPDVYLSGPPASFVWNRANGLKITTFNNGPFTEEDELVNPQAVTLDPLPDYIETVD
jgi:hypothetical protein